MLSQPKIMGILNVTPDSFSGDGLMQKTDYIAAALAQAEEMIYDGAAWLDVGGESTRPYADEVSEDIELARVIPVVQAIHEKHPMVSLSVDTRRPAVAEKALCAGAKMINDVSGVDADPAMASLAAQKNTKLVIMHNAARADKTKKSAVIGAEYRSPDYQDAVCDVKDSLAALVDSAMAAGVSDKQIILDPGLGFGKTPEQNLKLIKEIDAIESLGFPVLLAASRKSFIGHVLDSVPEDRLEGMAAIASYACLKQVDILRVHDVRFVMRTVKMYLAIAAS